MCIGATILTFSVSGLLSLTSLETHGLWAMTVAAVVYFTLFCLVSFLLGKKAIKSKDLNAMNKLFMVLVLAKLITALALVVIFIKWLQPDGKTFIIPFIVAYLLFTFIEVKSLRSLLKN